ncbi:HAD family hydrolase [Candidatus Enterococcus mansonii]|uniref:HAD superfamily hydrolase n=1 Tax=Candidatus Enterococcus mansonii TaxID=1834181 RepID=A0A242CE88_9ENTE|nr:HAD family phosphatase [Enterococcus sp. 4G2_DIV0659]OTO08092.1 hypothetical protein A5880_002362 [Enterococcus sp. 4G2_DIV0659]
MIKNIVFDMGNVLLRYKPAEFIKTFTDNEEYQTILLKEIFHSMEWIQYDRGTITKEELGMKVCKRVPEALNEMVSKILLHWHEEIKPIVEMEPVIKQLKEKGYQVYLLSNASSDYYTFCKKVPAIAYFDGVFISSDWKLIKPEAEIYRAFYSHFQLVPSECYFVDDLPINIESAANTGMPGCVFHGELAELLANFEKAGIQL